MPYANRWRSSCIHRDEISSLLIPNHWITYDNWTWHNPSSGTRKQSTPPWRCDRHLGLPISIFLQTHSITTLLKARYFDRDTHDTLAVADTQERTLTTAAPNRTEPCCAAVVENQKRSRVFAERNETITLENLVGHVIGAWEELERTQEVRGSSWMSL